jgi:hypothetical protein
MTKMPHDMVDLRLAPVALQVDARLEELGRLSPEALSLRVAIESNREGRTAQQRARDLVASVSHLLDLGGWEPSWDPRGLRLRHREHTLVLGVPATLRDYVEGVGRQTRAAVG